MMDVLVALMYTAVVIISILLIALILVQPSKGGGLGSAFAGIGESVFGAHTMGYLSKITIVLLCIFFALTLALAVVAGHRAKAGGLKNSLMANAAAPVKQEAKAVAAAPAEKKAAAPAAKEAKKSVPAAAKKAVAPAAAKKADKKAK